MHCRDSSECQGCTGSTSITCVHSAVARNSLTYLTALETPDRSEMDTRIKAQVKTHSQPRRDAREDTNRQQEPGTEQWTRDKRLKEQRRLCKALFVLFTQVSITLPSPPQAQTPRG